MNLNRNRDGKQRRSRPARERNGARSDGSNKRRNKINCSKRSRRAERGAGKKVERRRETIANKMQNEKIGRAGRDGGS